METLLFPGFAIYKNSWTSWHSVLKEDVLKGVNSLEYFTHSAPGISVHNSDYYNQSAVKPYVKTVQPLIDRHYEELIKELDCQLHTASLKEIWYQQYTKGDYHGWHTHSPTTFTNIYYVDLPEGTPVTKFRMAGKEYEIEIQEGDLISFPGHLEHRSPPNKTDKIKTVISFNIDLS